MTVSPPPVVFSFPSLFLCRCLSLGRTLHVLFTVGEEVSNPRTASSFCRGGNRGSVAWKGP